MTPAATEQQLLYFCVKHFINSTEMVYVCCTHNLWGIKLSLLPLDIVSGEVPALLKTLVQKNNITIVILSLSFMIYLQINAIKPIRVIITHFRR